MKKSRLKQETRVIFHTQVVTFFRLTSGQSNAASEKERKKYEFRISTRDYLKFQVQFLKRKKNKREVKEEKTS
jgi:hypothetical protein